MCLFKLESYFDLDQDVFFLKSYVKIADEVYEFCVKTYGAKDLLKYDCSDYYVLRLSLKCQDHCTRKLIKELLRLPIGCYFKIIKTKGIVLACLE